MVKEKMIVGLVFPHQLFEHSALLAGCDVLYVIEETLFFRQYSFHKQKIAFHRASMKFYEGYLRSKNVAVVYVESFETLADIRVLIPHLESIGVEQIRYIDPTDCWLEKRIANACAANGILASQLPSPMFLNTKEGIAASFVGKKRMFHADFYKRQRLVRNVLVHEDASPVGGKWSYDDENRLKYPKSKVPPQVALPEANGYFVEAVSYVEKHYPDNYGELAKNPTYPVDFEGSRQWLRDFFESRLSEFGAFEDSIVSKQPFLHHSVLTPMLNVGLLTPQFVLDQVLEYARTHDVPINSLEGFVRQLMGWREFIRAVYELRGTEERTRNFWGFTRKMPISFWKGTTGIEPIDTTIKKVLETGYCHHIERLMLLGNFLLLCEFDPDDVYRWFMEMFVDSYDWVMVPNVYGMSQFADGGIMATKPYISGSNYLMKMSDYKKGEWQTVWDGLFWRFLHRQRDFFLQNPRLSMLVHRFDQMDEAKKRTHLETAESFLQSL